VQVWYSATWSNSSLAAFRSAVSELLATATAASSLAKQQQQQAALQGSALAAPDVLKLLRGWQIKHVPLADARKGWQASLDHSFAWLSNFRRKGDRLALSELMLTGQIAALGAGDVGSVVMFAVPAEFGERAFDECFLQVRGDTINGITKPLECVLCLITSWLTVRRHSLAQM